MATVLYVCKTCRAGQPVTEGEACPGARLHAALAEMPAPDGVIVRAAECLSACDHGCSVALSKPGAWSYVYGRMTSDDAAEILRGAALYAGAPDGLVPWRDRPVIFRKQSLARIPPMEPTDV
jgi:predicted metal-binding protein